MNIYRVLIFNYGNSQSIIVQAFDAMQAIQNSGFPATDVVKVELIGSAAEVNTTDQTV